VSEQPTAVASIAPAPPAPPSKPLPKPAPETAPVDGVIGTKVSGKIEAPQFEVGDEWELLILTTNPTNRAAQPNAELRRFTAASVSPNWLTRASVKLDMLSVDPVVEL
jgi:hypothetical protein